MASESVFTVVVDKTLLSTVISAVAFVASVFISTTLQRSETDTVTSSVSLQDGDEDELDDEEEREWYLHRRLEHRLSFQNSGYP